MALLRNTIITGATGASGAIKIIGAGSTGDNYNILSTDSVDLVTFSVKDNGDTIISGNLTVNGTISPGSYTTGSVLFAGVGGAISQDNSQLFWDNTNNRLGIGTTAPSYTFDVNGDVRVVGNFRFDAGIRDNRDNTI